MTIDTQAATNGRRQESSKPRHRAGRRPIIAVATGDRRNRVPWILSSALLRNAGAKAVRTSPGRPIASFDGLLLLGGSDVTPTRYDAPLDPRRQIDSPRDAHELELLQRARSAGNPVLGICRGAQLINVACGGTLARVPTRRRRTPAPRRRVKIDRTSRVASILGSTAWANSLHEFAVDRVGKGVRVVGRDSGGVVQAIELGDDFVIGVQWHPELMPYMRDSRRLFRALVDACRQVETNAM